MNGPRLVLLGLCFGGACTPSFEDRPWRINHARILAVSATPAEVRPGQAVSLDALLVDPEGPALPPLEWSACTQPRTARERTAVSERCAHGEQLQPLGNPATVLSDACTRFGPNPPPTEGDAPAQRPADPDVTGGYFLPVRADLPENALQSFGFVRLRCDLAGVTRAVFEDYEARYPLNLGPEIDTLRLYDGASSAPLRPDEPPRVDPDGTIELELTTLAGTSEAYVVLDDDHTSLLDRREDLTVRWYVTEGELSEGEQTREGDVIGGDPSSFAVEWRAPSAPTRVHGWAVLVDDRGGVAWAAFALDVR